MDLRKGEAKPGDPTGDLAYNAEEAMADEGYLTPVESFFVRNHAPSIDPGFWTLHVERPSVERPASTRSESGKPISRANIQPNEVEQNDLGYPYDGVVGHPVEVV